MSQLGQAWALALSAAFFFGLALVLTQIGLKHLSAALGAVVSVPTATVLFWIVAPFKLDVEAWQTDAAGIFAVVGVLFPALVTLLTFEANLRMGPNIAGAVGNLAPFFAVSFAVFALGETPTLVQIIGISVIIVGVTVMSRQSREDGVSWPLWVLALPLAAAAIRGGIQPAVKLGLAQWPSPFAAALIGYSVSSAVVVAMAVIRTRGWPRGFNLRGSAWFCSVGLCNGMAVLLMYEALARGSVTLVSPLVASYPLATLALSALLLKTVQIDRRVVAGVSLTVAGVAFLLAG
jgi:drug/metabolite transporter (DMT)-like permease